MYHVFATQVALSFSYTFLLATDATYWTRPISEEKRQAERGSPLQRALANKRGPYHSAVSAGFWYESGVP